MSETSVSGTSVERLGEIMSPRPVCIPPDEHLDVARAVMVACRFRHLPVEKEHRLVGLLSLRELCAADLSSLESTAGERGLHLRGITVGSVMHHPVLTARPTATIAGASQAMLRHHLSCLPVVHDDDDEELAGIVTYSDFLGVAAARLRDQAARERHTPVVAALMTPRPLTTIGTRDRLDVAWSMMKAAGVRHLPVVDGEWLVGIVSDHDLLRADGSWVLEPLRDRLERRARTLVRQVMSEQVLTVGADDLAAPAALLLQERQIGALPVLRDGRLAGILTAADFFHHLVAAE
jgi:CBS domain-containing protein